MAKYTYGINSNTYNMLFDENKVIINFDKFSSKDEILYFIENFTLRSKKEAKKEAIFNPFIRYKRGLLKKDIFEKNNICVSHNGIKFKFLFLDNILPGIDEICDLRTSDRYGECMTLSIDLALMASSSGNKVNILTGYTDTYGYRNIHTVIEYVRNGKSYIMDATKNLIMSKENYFYLTNFELISEVDNFTMSEDFKKVKGMNLYTKPYFVFRNEIMKDMDKIKTLK